MTRRTFTSIWSDRLASITMRLRIALTLILLLIASAGVIAIGQARSILEIYETLTETARPMLDLAEAVQQDVDALTRTFENISSISSDGDLLQLRRDVSNQVDSILLRVQQLRSHDAIADDLASLETQLERAQVAALQAISERNSLLQNQNRLDQMLLEILQLQKEGQARLEIMTVAVSSAMDRLTRTEAADPALDQIKVRLNGMFQSTLHLAEIGFSTDRIVTTSLTLPELASLEATRKPAILVQEELRKLIGLLSQLRISDDRTALVQSLSDLRQILIGPEGFIARQQDQFGLREVVLQSRQDQQPLIDNLSLLSVGLVARSLAVVDTSTAALQAALQNLTLVLFGAFAVSASTIVFTNFAIVEGQFNKRVASLNTSTRAIAAGDLDHLISVHGQDELGDMAAALEVFRKTAKDLERSNDELEKFAYVAAHDLRAPLRALSDLSSWITEDPDNHLSGESAAYLDLMQQRIARLDQLLRDLLTYARAGHHLPEQEEIDLPALVREQMHLADPENRFAMTYDGPDLSIRFELTALQQILSNLLSNAVRHHDRSEGHITVRATVTHDKLDLWVTDDGPGIPPRYQTKVFELFQTLKPRDEVEGSGLGLSILRKIADRHHGEITLRSDPGEGRGTEIHVTLSLSQALPQTVLSQDQAA